MARKGGAPENLNPVRTKEEAKKRGQNGGKKSGEARRRKRDAKEAAKLILNLPCTEAISKNLKTMSVDEEDYTNRVALFARAFTQAMTGDVKAMEFIVEMAGETPRHQLEVKRYEDEAGRNSAGGNVVDDWVSSIPDVVDEEEDDSGEEQSQQET